MLALFAKLSLESIALQPETHRKQTMRSTEYTANAALQANAAERARWAAVLAAPTRAPRTVRRVSLLARIVARFA